MKNNIALSYFIDYMTAIGLFDSDFTLLLIKHVMISRLSVFCLLLLEH